MPNSRGVGVCADDLTTLDTHVRSASHSTCSPCPTCGDCFETRELLQLHISEGCHLAPPRPVSQFDCARCSRACADQQDLDHHHQLHQFRCSTCNLDFTGALSLSFHRRMFHEQQLGLEHGVEEQAQTTATPIIHIDPVSPESWFNTIRRVITSVVQYTFASDASDQRLRARQAPRAPGYAISLSPRPQTWHSQRTTTPGIPTRATGQSTYAMVVRPRPTPAPPRSAPPQSTNNIAPVQQAHLLQASRPIASQRDSTATTGTWAGQADTQPTQIWRSQGLADLSRPGQAPHLSNYRTPPVQQAPDRHSTQIAAPPIRRLVPLQLDPRLFGNMIVHPLQESQAHETFLQAVSRINGSPAPVQQTPLSSISVPGTRRSTNIILPAQQASARQLPQTATPCPAPVRQAPLLFPPAIQRREAQQARTDQPARLFRCEQCSRQFNSGHGLNRHRSAVHARNPIPEPVARAREIPDAPRSTCLSCHKTFVNQYALDQHLVSNAHPENRIDGQPGYRCIECGAVFGTRDLLTLHAAGHVQERLRRG